MPYAVVLLRNSARSRTYCILFDNNGPVMQLPVPKGRTVTGTFYKNCSFEKVEGTFQDTRPKTGLKYLRLLHVNAPANKARIVTGFLESEEVNVLPHPPF